jgi:KTSC domain
MAATASSAILRIWYEPNDELLFVTFVGGKTYAYEDVPRTALSFVPRG